MKPSYSTVINIDQVKEIYPEIGETGAQLMLDYMNLTRAAIKLGLLEETMVVELDQRHMNVENIMERLHYQSADVLSLLKDLVNSIQVPADSKEFENWVIHSEEYPKVLCHDAFFDVFMGAKKALVEEIKK